MNGHFKKKRETYFDFLSNEIAFHFVPIYDSMVAYIRLQYDRTTSTKMYLRCAGGMHMYVLKKRLLFALVFNLFAKGLLI